MSLTGRVRRPLAAAATFACAAAALLLPQAAPAVAEPHWPGESSFRTGTARACTPNGRTCVSVEGRGFGHGKGMSQYGAKGAAERGLTWPKILGFYYPGTSWGTYTGAVRVLVTADTDKDTIVRPRAGLVYYDHGTGKATALPTTLGATLWKLHPRTTDGKTLLSYLANGTWRPQAVLASLGEFRAPGPITLRLPGGVERRYRGHLRNVAWQQPDGKRTVNVVAIDDYLKGVVPREMPALWSAHAVRAQSVAARTYALHERQARLGRPWEICDTTSCQVYGGFDDEHPASNDAIARTAGRYLTYGGAPAFTQFSASNGGYSVAGSRAYLVAKADPYDGYPTWRTTASTWLMSESYPEIGAISRLEVRVRDDRGAFGGRVRTLRIHGQNGSWVDVSGEDARYLLGLKSSMFRLP